MYKSIDLHTLDSGQCSSYSFRPELSLLIKEADYKLMQHDILVPTEYLSTKYIHLVFLWSLQYLYSQRQRAR